MCGYILIKRWKWISIVNHETQWVSYIILGLPQVPTLESPRQ